MKIIIHVFFVLAGILSCVISNAGETVSLADCNKLITDTFLEIRWVNDRYFTYSPTEDGFRTYYLVDTRTWKQIKMFDNREFAESLNKISQGGQSQKTSA